MQREVSAQFGCGFFDLVRFMGGPMSMLEWCDGEPPFGASDHVHFTPRGYQALGNVLHDALLEGYDRPPALIGGERALLLLTPGSARRADVAGAEPVATDASAPTLEQQLPLSAEPPDSPRSPSSKPGSTYRR
jgi:hypothetical protein